MRSRTTLRVGERGPELLTQRVQRGLYQASVGTLLIEKESPSENRYAESFKKKRDELLNRELFLSLEEARWVIDCC